MPARFTIALSLTCAGLLIQPCGAQTQTSTAMPRQKSVKATAAQTAQPLVLPNAFEKCIDCRLAAKRRVAVLPVEVGTVATDAQTPPDYLSSKMIDAIEGALKNGARFVVSNRSDLAEIMKEQALGTAGITNRELAPGSGRIIPAELLLKVRLDRVDVTVSTQRNVSSNATELRERARAAEQQALQARENAAANQRAVQQAMADTQEFQKLQKQNMQQMQGATSRSALNLGMLVGAVGSWGESESKQRAERELKEAQENFRQAERRFLEARQLREQAERDAQNDLIDTRRTKATLVVLWKAIDSMTGQVVTGDQLTLQDENVDERKASFSGDSGTDAATVSRGQDLVNKLIDRSVDELAAKISDSIEKVPFRVQVVKVDRDGIVINGGKNLGVEIGDTFSVKRVDRSLIDPSTGESLSGPGELIGLIRVGNVADRTGSAVVIQSAGVLKRGDVLEWVGAYR